MYKKLIYKAGLSVGQKSEKLKFTSQSDIVYEISKDNYFFEPDFLNYF